MGFCCSLASMLPHVLSGFSMKLLYGGHSSLQAYLAWLYSQIRDGRVCVLLPSCLSKVHAESISFNVQQITSLLPMVKSDI